MNEIYMHLVFIERKDSFLTSRYELIFESETKKYRFAVTANVSVPEKYRNIRKELYPLSDIVEDFKEEI